jgi:hypothetical protein
VSLLRARGGQLPSWRSDGAAKRLLALRGMPNGLRVREGRSGCPVESCPIAAATVDGRSARGMGKAIRKDEDVTGPDKQARHSSPDRA